MSVKRYPVIGGPLNGETAVFADFYPAIYASITVPGYAQKGDLVREAGMHVAYADSYVPYNRNGGHRDVPTMIFLYKKLLP